MTPSKKKKKILKVCYCSVHPSPCNWGVRGEFLRSVIFSVYPLKLCLILTPPGSEIFLHLQLSSWHASQNDGFFKAYYCISHTINSTVLSCVGWLPENKSFFKASCSISLTKVLPYFIIFNHLFITNSEWPTQKLMTMIMKTRTMIKTNFIVIESISTIVDYYKRKMTHILSGFVQYELYQNNLEGFHWLNNQVNPILSGWLPKIIHFR